MAELACCPSHLRVQWHITDRCNLSCAHCYQDGAEAAEPNLARLRAWLVGIKRWRDDQRAQHDCDFSVHVLVSGGEPLLHPDFFPFLELLASEDFPFAILTNGLLLDREACKRLRKLKPAFVQVSLDGHGETHDRWRGKGNYDAVLGAVKRINRASLRAVVAFTATRRNFREFPTVARAASRAGATRIWADRHIPIGRGSELADLALTAEETTEFHGLMAETARSQPAVSMHRALQFLAHPGHPYRCTAGDELVAILPDGTVLPCRRLPLPMGNLRSSGFRRIYHGAEMERLRERNVPYACHACFYQYLCAGGLRCLSFALTGVAGGGDPGCAKVEERRSAD